MSRRSFVVLLLIIAVLAAVGQLIRDRSRAHDLAARYGGEEFAIILPETRQEGAAIFAEKIRHGVELTPVDPERGIQSITVSAGVASLNIEGPDTAPTLVEAADAQLYRAKSLGRNRVCTAEEEGPAGGCGTAAAQR